jgi:hypothetical protein
VADRLHMTVARLRDEIPQREFLYWQAYLIFEAEEHDKAAKKAAAEARRRG